jgi:hypothetical protein
MEISARTVTATLLILTLILQVTDVSMPTTLPTAMTTTFVPLTLAAILPDVLTSSSISQEPTTPVQDTVVIQSKEM